MRIAKKKETEYVLLRDVPPGHPIKMGDAPDETAKILFVTNTYGKDFVGGTDRHRICMAASGTLLGFDMDDAVVLVEGAFVPGYSGEAE